MGSQVNFYMVQADEVSFCQYVTADSSTVILKATDPECSHVPLFLPLPSAAEAYYGNLVLWNSDIVDREDITPPNKILDSRNSSGCYNVHAYVYPVIQLLRSKVTNGGLTPGRIWAETDRPKMELGRQKAFKAWFRRLARWLNNWPYRSGMYRIGPKTKEYFDAGGKAVGYAVGKPISVTEVGQTKVVRSQPEIRSEHPAIEDDGGESDLTMEI